MEIEFRLNGQILRLNSSQVETAMASTPPEPLRLHAVRVGGTLYPPKQVFSEATGLDRLDFTTNQARTQLKRLGFEVLRLEGGE